MASPKSEFDKILSLLESVVVAEPEKVAKMLKTADGINKLKVSQAQQFINSLNSAAPVVLSQNKVVVSIMPKATTEQWLVNVRPDAAGTLHFQGRTPGVPSTGPYTRWYMVVPEDTLKAVQGAFESKSSEFFRSSFSDGSETKYMICSRSGETGVSVLDEVIEVPELFGVNNQNAKYGSPSVDTEDDDDEDSSSSEDDDEYKPF